MKICNILNTFINIVNRIVIDMRQISTIKMQGLVQIMLSFVIHCMNYTIYSVVSITDVYEIDKWIYLTKIPEASIGVMTNDARIMIS